MNRTGYGVISLILGIIAVFTGFTAIVMHSFFYGGLYLVSVVICGILIIKVFCIKCPIKDQCVHIIPGFIAKHWKEKAGPYTSSDHLVTGVLFAIIILPPQGFLFSIPGLFLVFWCCIIIAGICCNRFLCPDCGNTWCPFCRNN